MDFADFARAVFALALTLGLVGLAAVAFRRFGPDAMARFGAAARRERRMAIVETLVLDPTRRVVLISVDGQEKLVLLGEGRELGHAPTAPACAGESA
jgi:flagellar protein FliO/FliZ